MSRAPRVSGLELISVLGRAGFTVVRVRGSHHFGETIGPGLLNKIMRDCKRDADQLRRLLLG